MPVWRDWNELKSSAQFKSSLFWWTLNWTQFAFWPNELFLTLVLYRAFVAPKFKCKKKYCNSIFQCPNPQGGSTGAAISCGRGSWFDPVVCNCQPGRPNCSAIRGSGSSSSGGAQRPPRPQRPSRPGSSRRCAFTGCAGVRDSVTVYPDPQNSFGFIQCDGNGRAVRQQCNGIRFNLQTCNC